MKEVWSITVEAKTKLIQSGFFKYIRHPLYLGTMSMCLGAMISTKNYYLFPILIINLIYVYIRALIEEKILIKKLKGYKDYMKKTKRFFPKIF